MMRLAVAFVRVIGAGVGKLTVLLVRATGYMLWVGGLYWGAMLLLQGVAQTEGEGLAKMPESAAGVWGRLSIVCICLGIGFCGCLLHQTIRLLSQGLGGDFRERLLRVVFKGLVFWGGACLFICLLMLAGSFQARWQVARPYYWVAGTAGLLVLILLGAAELVHRRLSSARQSFSESLN